MNASPMILLVEDHADTALAIAKHLMRHGYVVEVVGTVDEALSLCDRQRFDLAIVDVRLPDGSGLEVVRALLRRCDAPVMVVSADGTREAAEASLQAGAIAHLVKPIGIDQLLEVMQAYLNSPSDGALDVDSPPVAADPAAGDLVLSDFSGNAEPDDRRREPRFASQRMIEIARVPQDTPADAAAAAPTGSAHSDIAHSLEAVELVDCSASGLCFQSPRPMAPGASFVARLRFRGLTMILYSVRHCQPVKGDVYRIGAELAGYTAVPADFDGAALLEALRSG